MNLLINPIAGAEVAVSDCLNLCPRHDGPGLCPVHTPTLIDNLPSQPLAVLDATCEPPLMAVTRGLKVYALSPANSNSSGSPAHEYLIGHLPAEPLCHTLSGDTLTVMTERGIMKARRDERGIWRDVSRPALNVPVAIEAVRDRDYSTFVTLPAADSAIGSPSDISDRHRRTILSAITGAHRDMTRRATADGLLTAPVLARAIISDRRRGRLFVTPPVLLMPPAPSDAAAPIAFTSDDRLTFATRPITVTSYRPRIRLSESLPDGYSADELTVTLQLSPQFETIDADGTHLIDVSRTPGQGYLKVTLARHIHSLSPEAPASARDTISRAMPRLDSLMTSCGTPIAYAPGTHDIHVATCQTGDSADLCRALAAPVPDNADLARVSPPHGFVARCGAVQGSTALWGDITPVIFEGYSPVCYATAFEDTPWRARAQVTFDSGHSTVIWQGEGETGAPTSFGPLISYPSPRADAITMIIELGDRTLTHHVRLGTVPGAPISWSLDISLAPSPAIEADEPALPDLPAPVAENMAECLLVTEASNPAAPSATVRLDSAPVALTQAFSFNHLWNFAGTRYYAYTPAGIYEVSADHDGRRLLTNRLDVSPVVSARHVAIGRGCAYVLSGSRLLSLTGTRTAVAMPYIHHATAIGWDDAHNCLIAAISDGPTRHYRPDSAMSCYQSDHVDAHEWLAERGHVTADLNSRLLLLSHGTVAGSTHIIWSGVLSAPRTRRTRTRPVPFPTPGQRHSAPPVITAVTAMIDAGVIDGSIDISRDYLHNRHATCTRLDVHGAVHTPLFIPMSAHRLTTARVTIDAEVTPDTVLTGVTAG